MDTSHSVALLLTAVIQLSCRWALLSGKENSTQSISAGAKDEQNRRRLLSNATSDWLDSIATAYKHFSEQEADGYPLESPVPSVEPERENRMATSVLRGKLLVSLGIYLLCWCIHWLTVKLIRLFLPFARLPFILQFPKPQVSDASPRRRLPVLRSQVTIAVMLIPPLLYAAAIASRDEARGFVASICFLLPLPCALCLLYSVFRPGCGARAFRSRRVSTWEEPQETRLQPIDETIAADAPSSEEERIEESAGTGSEPASLSFGKASLAALGKAPTLVLEDNDDTARKLPKAALTALSHAPTLVLEDDTEEEDSSATSDSDDGEIEREEVNPTNAVPVRRRATRWQRKSAMDASRAIAEGIESPKAIQRQSSAEAPLLEGADSEFGKEADSLLAVYGSLFDDVIGQDDCQARKHASVACLLSLFLHFTCRVISAVLFGAFDVDAASRTQIRLLLSLHSAYLIYLACVRPYANRALMLAELICNLCEWSILVTVITLTEMEGDFDAASTLLLTSAYLDIGTLTAYEFIRMGKYMWLACHSNRKPMISVMDQVIVKKE